MSQPASELQVIGAADALAEKLAGLARGIREATHTMIRRQEGGRLRRLHQAFQTALIHDLTEEDFADSYAQTIACGLLAAAILGDDISEGLHGANPFLKETLQTFQAPAEGADFDGLGVRGVIDLLRGGEIDLPAILRDFGNKKRGEDPVIHFYERFLAIYDKKLKVKRGVFYTPQPVVSYIVRSVHELLRDEFGLEDGLADTTTWEEFVARKRKRDPQSDIRIPEGVGPDSPFVQILDPAAGAGTFLIEVIDVIHRTMTDKWTKQGLKEDERRAAWNEYAPKHLIPRLHGYELMLAPYAIAHMKLRLKLKETGFTAWNELSDRSRARIFLTNALEPPGDEKAQVPFAKWAPALAREAAAVNEIKRRKRFTVVIGNPPYSASMSEPAWLMALLDDWKKGLDETKSDLNREELKFLRFGQYHCLAAGAGILGFVINRDFLDGVTKRRMREHLGQSFPLRIVVDLNGDVRGNIADENVFDIEQGVAVVLLGAKPAAPGLRFASRVGTRAQKYADLASKKPIDESLTELAPTAPYFRWTPFASARAAGASIEYSEWPSVKDIFSVVSSGIQTKRDGLCVAFTRTEMWERIERFHALSIKRARDEFKLGDDGRDWTVASAKADVAASGPSEQFICPILYRPFDVRFTYWTGRTRGFLAYPRRDVMRHVAGRRNIGMIFNRQIVGDRISHFGVARIPICHGTFYLGNKGQDYFAPLYLSDGHAASNLTHAFTASLRAKLGCAAPELAPEDIFNYACAVFHSPGYRSRYAEFLKIDFPRLPAPGGLELFRALAGLGGELVALSLLEFALKDEANAPAEWPRYPRISNFTGFERTVTAKFPAAGKAWKDGRVAINAGGGFESVPEDVWNFHIGGYQVCHKWLKDREGRALTDGDILHYCKIVNAINDVIRLMRRIDEVINERGGWPGAFTGLATLKTSE